MSISPRVRLYGHVLGESSFTQVTRGMKLALEAIGEFAGLWPIDTEEGEGEASGMSAPVSLNLGNPRALLQAHRYGGHQKHWLLLAPNSEGLPHGFAEALSAPSEVLPKGMLTGGLLTPSHWAAGVLAPYFPEHRILVAPHGVSPVHRVDAVARDFVRTSYADGYFRVLHMTSTDAERKGTKLLLRAWADLKRKRLLPERAILFVFMNPIALGRVRWWCRELELTEKDVTVCAGFTTGQDGVAELYSAMHVVCQPSRAEGFGLVPLEALACGVPVVATAGTGHTEYVGSDLFSSEVPGGFMPVIAWPPTSIDDYPGAVAPRVEAEDIGTALKDTYDDWRMLARIAERAAPELAEKWDWKTVSRLALEEMVKET
jgi:glycosyltransferase involved in cell wall biosynthesis